MGAKSEEGSQREARERDLVRELRELSGSPPRLASLEEPPPAQEGTLEEKEREGQ